MPPLLPIQADAAPGTGGPWPGGTWLALSLGLRLDRLPVTGADYAWQQGIGRVMAVLRGRGLPLTLWADPSLLRDRPDKLAQLRAAGLDLCHFGALPADAGAAAARLAALREQAKTLFGEVPAGWVSSHQPWPGQRAWLMAAGFLYDADASDQDAPAWDPLPGGEARFLVLPDPLAGIEPDQPLSGFWRACGHALKRMTAEPAIRPAFWSLGINPAVSGSPAGAAALADFLDLVNDNPGIWCARRIDIARACWRQRPPARPAFSRASTGRYPPG